MDYGIRWDFTPTEHERYYRTSGFSPAVQNPSAGGLLGGMAYEGFGTGRCNCNFMPSYPYAIGPRLGAAYQIDPKTVLRGGWGFTYGQANVFNYLGGNTNVVGVGFNLLTFSAPSFGTPNTTLSNGFQYNPASVFAASLNPGIVPVAGSVSNSPSPWFDRNGGRPPRINNWNLSLQREITPNLIVEAAYVGNRAVWLVSGDASNFGLNNLNELTMQRIASFGLNVSSTSDRSLLTSTFASGLPQQRGFKIPYTGFPTGATLAQSLRPYPQFSNIYTEFSPLGSSWYDALQAKITKRFSHGLQMLTAFTWSKQQGRGFDNVRGRGAQINDSLNYAVNKDLVSTSQPFVIVTSFTYQIPTPSALQKSRLLKEVLGGWTLGGVVSIGSGLPIRVPGSTNNLSQLTFQGRFVNRVPGVSPFLQDPNCHCFDPNTTAVLNPAAWVDPGAGNWGTAAAYYNDYRWQRVHDEEANLAKSFKYRERLSFQIRAEFFKYFQPYGPSNAVFEQYHNAADAGDFRLWKIEPGISRIAPYRPDCRSHYVLIFKCGWDSRTSCTKPLRIVNQAPDKAVHSPVWNCRLKALPLDSLAPVLPQQRRPLGGTRTLPERIFAGLLPSFGPGSEAIGRGLSETSVGLAVGKFRSANDRPPRVFPVLPDSCR